MAAQRRLCRISGLFLGALALLLGLGLTGCMSPPQMPLETGKSLLLSADPVRAKAVFTALQMLGAPYLWGGDTPAGFDCSGLVQYAYANGGLTLPRTVAAQEKVAAPVTLDQAAAGDLLFFWEGGEISHVALYLGTGRFVHAPRTGQTVALDNLTAAYWRSRLAWVGRVLTPPD